MKFPRQDLRDMAWGVHDGTKYEVVLNEASGESSRWREYYDLVFKFEGKFYSSYYERGLTENCDHNMWEWEPDMVECDEVVPVEKIVTTIEYVKV